MAGDTYGSKEKDASLGEAGWDETLGTTGGGSTAGGPGASPPPPGSDVAPGPGKLSKAGIAHDFSRPAERKVKNAPLHTPEASGQISQNEADKAHAGAPLSGSEQIEKLLAPYVKELQNLGPEYQQEMQYLAPYLNQTGAEAPQTFGGIVAQSKAQESSTGNTAVNAADAAAGSAIENQGKPGFAGEAAAGKQYAQSVPYQEPLQAALGYQKYLETYGGQPVNTSSWNPQAQQAYAAALGPTGGSSGLPSITSANASQNANTLLTPPGTTTNVTQ